DAIHAQVGVTPAGPGDLLGVDLRQRHEGAAVLRPAPQLRQLTDRRLMSEDGTAADVLRQSMPGRAQYPEVAPGALPEGRRIDLQIDEAAHGGEGVAEE